MDNVRVEGGGSAAAARPWGKLPELAVVAGLTILAILLRAYRLGDWSFALDELHTLRDSLTTSVLQGPKPLLFFLNHHFVLPWTELNELSLRLLPALFGVLAVPALYWLVRRAVDWKAALVVAGLVVIHPWHLYWSQFARYYSLVFLLTAVFGFAAYVGVREKRLPWLLGSVAIAMLAVLAHPTSGLVLAGVAFWAILEYGRLHVEGRYRLSRRAWLTVGIVLALVAIVAVRLASQLLHWQSFGFAWGHTGLVLLLSYVDWVSLTLGCFALAGLVWMWYVGERSLALFVASAVGLPLAFLVVVSHYVSVSTGYLFATFPFALLAAAFFIGRLTEMRSDGLIRQLVAATCVAVIVASSAPRILSQFRDGSRLDYRSAARHLASHAAPSDVVLADYPRLTRHYLTSPEVGTLKYDEAVLNEALQRVQGSGTLWLVPHIRSRGGFREIGFSTVEAWVRQSCRLSGSFVEPRLDFKRNEVRVYECQPHPATGVGWSR